MCQDVPNTYLFGYGSLIWRCGFVYEHKFHGYIRGYRRLFHQVDRYHRGTEQNPGRCALIEHTGNMDDVVYGTCYLVRDDDVHDILNGLDKRERNYVRIMEQVYLAPSLSLSPSSNSDEDDDDIEVIMNPHLYTRNEICVTTAFVYAVMPSSSSVSSTNNNTNNNSNKRRKNNSSSLCELTTEERSIEYTARVIAFACGHSGTNFDYLHRLYHCLKQMNGLDEYMVQLYRRVLQIRESHHHYSLLNHHQIHQCQHYRSLLQQKQQLLNAPIMGCVYIDSGAVSALSNKGKALLPCGIVSVVANEPERGIVRGDAIEIKCHGTRETVAYGISNYSSSEIDIIKGKHSKYISQLLLGESQQQKCQEKRRSSMLRTFVEHVVSQERMVLY